MTVKELIELNNCIGDMTITVRGGSNGGIRLREYRIGTDAGEKGPYPDEKTTYKEVAINARDNEKDYYQLLIKQIPKPWLALKVKSWHVYKSYRRAWGEATHSFEHIHIDVYEEGWKEDEEPEKKENSQLDGQITFEDIPGVMP